MDIYILEKLNQILIEDGETMYQLMILEIKMSKIEETGGELTGIPNEKYQKFFVKFAEIDTLPVEQWKLVHLLSYFCRKYKETYQLDYAWKFNNPNPNKCFEVWQMNTLVAKLSAKPQILKDYIDWAYDNLVPKAKRRFTSLSFMTKDEVVNPYKMEVLFGKKSSPNIDRSTPLPEKYHQALGKYFSSITTYGALAFAMQMDPKLEGLDEALERMKVLGFDMEILKRVV